MKNYCTNNFQRLVLYEHVNKEWVKLSQFYVLLTNVKSESMYEKSTPQKIHRMNFSVIVMN